MAKVIFGCGYLGLRVAQRWLAAGAEVWAATRTAARARELAAQGLHPFVCDITRPFAAPVEWTQVDTVLFAVGFDRTARQSMEEVYVGGLARSLAVLPISMQKLIYISSTGVYGQTAGEWVDEDSPCQPTRPGGRACLAAERLLAAHPLGARSVILRLAGIYGPGRIPKLEAIQSGQPLEVTPDGFLNLIHVEDAADLVLAVERQADPPALYTVTDGHPVLRGDFYRQLARLIGAPAPQFETPSNESPHGQRASGDKRVSNRRLTTLVRRPLRFPSYQEGLAAILAGTAG